MRKKAVSKEQIIETAESLIREEGLKHCSMRRLCKDLSIASGTVYNYYSNRQELLMDVFNKSWNQTFMDMGSAIDRSGSLIDGLKVMHRILVRDISNRNGLGGELMAEGEDALKQQIRGEHLKLMNRLLDMHVKKEDQGRLNRWLRMLLMDLVLEEEAVTEGDWERIAGLISAGQNCIAEK